MPTPAPSHRAPSARYALLSLAFGAVGLLLVGLVSLAHTGVMVDEHLHHAQIASFHHGDGSLHPRITTFATYHWLVAQALTWVEPPIWQAARWVSAASGLLLVLVAAVAWGWRAHGDARVAALRAALVVLMPVLLPYVFLIYTDPLGLAFVLVAAWAAEARRWWLAALFIACAAAVRQTQIVWALWLLALYAIREAPALRTRADWLRALSAIAPLGLVLAAFAVFVVVNGGVAIGDRDAHPSSGLHDGNILFGLFVAMVMFLPVHIAAAPAVVAMVRRKPLACWAGAIGVCAWFAVGFEVDHLFNLLPGYLHNDVAVWLARPENRVLFAVPVAWTALSLVALLDRGRETWAWVAASLLALGPHWMIEHRYGIVALALWQVLRRPLDPAAEWMLAIWVAGWGVAMLHLIRPGTYFL
jgi:alpha-1,2-glucosyltransferase